MNPVSIMFKRFSNKIFLSKDNPSSYATGIVPARLERDQLWQQCLADKNLDQALGWLKKQSHEQDRSDVWAYAQHWESHKADLQQRLKNGSFRFQVAREVELSDELGQISRRETFCAEDRLLIRAIAQVLKPVFGQSLSTECMHLSGNGGSKAAVAQAQATIQQHPDHHVIKSDVKGYYAHIDHTILQQQLHQLLPNENKLNRLLWQFMRRTVEFGGNYRDIERGLPLGASLSPLLGALYLSPLDELAQQTPDTFYRRYMDDWVWVFPKKQILRKSMKKQTAVLHTLRMAMHPAKTFIGKVKKGLDFRKVSRTPTEMTVSEAASSQCELKVVRLYEKGLSKQPVTNLEFFMRKRSVFWDGLALCKWGVCNVQSFSVSFNKVTTCFAARFSSRSLFGSLSALTLLVSTLGISTANANSSTSWESLGPGNIGGRTRTMAINPNTPETMYTAGVAGGVWKSVNGGDSWTPVSDAIANMAVTTIVIDPNNHDTLYAGTGEGFYNGDAVRGDGIFKSTDGGSSWTHLSATTNNSNFHYVNKLAVSSNDSNRIYAATREGIFRSTDGGATWSQVKTKASISDTVGCLDMQIRTDVNPDILIAACGSFSRGSIQRSADGGDTWTEVLNEPNMGRTTLAIASSNQNTMYALSASNASGNYKYGLHAVFKSTDGGVSWTAAVRNTDSAKLNTLLLSNTVYGSYSVCGFGSDQFFNQGWYNNIIVVDPANENIVWAGGIDLFRSDDGGANWGLASVWWQKTASQYVHQGQHGIYFHPDYNGTTNKTAFFSHDGGLSKTTDARATVDTSADAACNLRDSGFTFTSLNNNYAVTQFYHGQAYPDGATFFGGAEDNGTIIGTTAGGMTWSGISGGDGGYVAIDPSNTDIVFAEAENRDFQKSTNGGSSFSPAVSGISEGSFNFAYITPFVMDPNNSQNLWIGGRTLWKTTDQADNWTQASTTDMSSTSITAWAVATGDSNYVAAGNSSGDVFYNTTATSADSNSTWSSSKPANGVISSLTYDPNDKNTLYATYSTFSIDHIYKSSDAGVTWTAIDKRDQTDGIPDIPVHTLAIDPEDSSSLYAGTDQGVYVSKDGGDTWTKDDSGLPNTVVETLQILKTESSKYMFAFTHGRGAWRAELENASTTTAQTISFTPPTSKTFGDAPFTVSASSDSNLTVSVSSDTTEVCTIDAQNKVTLLKIGTCTLTASQAGNAQYDAAQDVTANITVNPVNKQSASDGTELAIDKGHIFSFTSSNSSTNSTVNSLLNLSVFQFTVENLSTTTAETVEIKLTLPNDIASNALVYKIINGKAILLNANTHGLSIDHANKTVTFNITDNGDLDSDATLGKIVDPVAIGTPSTSTTATTRNGGGSFTLNQLFILGLILLLVSFYRYQRGKCA